MFQETGNPRQTIRGINWLMEPGCSEASFRHGCIQGLKQCYPRLQLLRSGSIFRPHTVLLPSASPLEHTIQVEKVFQGKPSRTHLELLGVGINPTQTPGLKHEGWLSKETVVLLGRGNGFQVARDDSRDPLWSSEGELWKALGTSVHHFIVWKVPSLPGS